MSRCREAVPADRGAEIRYRESLPVAIAADDGYHPGMARDRRAAERSLVAGRGNDDDAAPARQLERLAQGALGAQSSLRYSHAEIDDVSTDLDHFEKCGGQLSDGCAGYARVLRDPPPPPKNRVARQACSPGQMPGTALSRFAFNSPAT